MNPADEEAYRHFSETLNTELTQNIKPIILSLTMLAEDYRDNSHVIAQSIEEYIRKVSPDLRILGLYLMDSIMKNIKQKTNYIKQFERIIVPLFSFVFESVNEQNRKALYKLRQTWSDIFSFDQLHNLDVSVKMIDPAWPITATKSTIVQPNQTQTVIKKVNNNSDQPKQVTLPNNNSNTSNNINNSNNKQVNNHHANNILPELLSTSINISKPSSLVSSKSVVNSDLNQEAKTKQQLNNQVIDKAQVNNNNARLNNQQSKETNSNPTNRDPRLINRNPKQQATTNNSENVNSKQQNVPRPVTNKQQQKQQQSVSPPSKRINSDQNSKLSSNQQQSNGIKRSSPNSQQTPISEIKKPKMSSPTSKPSSENTNNNSESPLKQNKQLLNSNNKTTSQTENTQKQKLPNNSQHVISNTNSNNSNTAKPARIQKTDNDSNSTSKTPPKQNQSQKTSSNNTSSTVNNNTSITTTTTTTTNQSQRSKAEPVRKIKLLDYDEPIKPTPKENTDKTPNQTSADTNGADDNENLKKTNTNSNNYSNQQQPVNNKKKIPSLFDLTVEPVDMKPVINFNNKLSNNNTKKVSSNKNNADLNKQKTILIENHVNYANDVDERFTDDMNKQIDTFTNLISNNVNNNDHMSPFTNQINQDSTAATNKEVIDKLELNSNSLNELKERLLASQQNDNANNQSNVSSNTQDIIETIRNLLNEQKELMSRHSQFKQDTNHHQLDQQQQSVNMCDTSSSQTISTTDNNNSQSSEQSQADFINSNLPNQDNNDQEMEHQSYQNDIVSYNDLPPIRPRDKNENQNDSLLIIDGRSYRIQPDVRRLIKIYYHDHELFCDTRTKDVYLDKKRVYKMGDTTKEVMLNGRRVRLMYMGKRIEIWIDGISFHFRADSPPKQITMSSSQSNQLKKYYVTIDSKTMDMYFNNFKVCQINGGQYGNGANIIMARLAPDDFEQHEISFVCPPKRIMIDGLPRKMRYDLAVPCIEMDNGEFFIIRFSGPAKEIFIDDTPYLVEMDKTARIKLNNRSHELAWGGPGFEVIIDGRPYEIQFNKPPREIIIGTRPHSVYICGDPPDVKICGRVPDEILQEDNENNQDFNSQQQQQPKPVPLMSQPAMPVIPNLPILQTLDLHKLVQKLNEHGILPKTAKKEETSTQQTVQPQVEEKVPDLTSLDVELLKKKYDGAIQKLYSGVQCSQCGNRFNQNNDQAPTGSTSTANTRYSKHLDWHFRQNKKEKEEINKAHSRSWYYSLPDWLLYEELSEDAVMSMEVDNNVASTKKSKRSNEDSNDNESISSGSLLDENDMISMEDRLINSANLDENDHQSNLNSAKSNNNNNKSINSAFSNLNGVKTCPATNDVGDSCHICNDPFDIFYYEEKEEWHFKDAIRVGNKLYHPICFEDANNDANNTMNMTQASSVPSTPSASIHNSFNNPFDFNNQLNNDSINNSFVKDEPIET